MLILSRYVIREHIGPFFFAFFIVTFVLILDFIPQVIELIIGKDLSTWTVVKLFVLNLAWMLALSVPMAVLVSSLMAFGRLTSDKEILAIKTSGINLVRLMIPVIIIASLLGVGLIWFNNEVLPEANHEAATLRGDIQRLRPTFRLQSGVFIDYIPGYIILVENVNHRSSKIKGVVIYDQKNPKMTRTITADSGIVSFSAKGESITFDLRDGEIHEQSVGREAEYRVSSFRSQTFVVDNLGTKLEETERSYRGDREMSTAELRDMTDTWEEENEQYRQSIIKDTDSVFQALLQPPAKLMSIKDKSEESKERVAAGQAYNEQVQLTRLLRTRSGQIASNEKLIAKYRVEIYKKYSLPTACLVFVLIGAPLGVINRRGGMATSIGVSIGLFTLYWACLIGGEQLADRMIIPPWTAMWGANIILTLVGLLLLYRVKNERSPVTLLKTILWRRKQ